MTRTHIPRILVLTLMLLCQLTAAMTIVCDEGFGKQVMEFILETCCDDVAGTEDTCEADAPCIESNHGECGPCIDAPLTLLLQKQEEQHTLSFGVHVAPVEFPAVVFATPDLRATTLRDTHRDGACGAVAEFSRTVVLTC